MLPKTQKTGFWKFVKGGAKTLFVIEAVCFAVTYGVYYRMNTNRDFRQYMNTNFPFVLDYYYKIGETLGDSNIRSIDSTYWRAEAKKSE
ncbi:protein CEBPZOS-like isoform X1 [Episyrphus balteatus]|uniref:protein CEBPZOS-like isoform X1 n=1 Tax=Episyrphus balteatus TaxID=286459 RepID=UPI0024861659|nr:protein CEBPZOS-like isoform X1 [Episyrphus balteatus]